MISSCKSCVGEIMHRRNIWVGGVLAAALAASVVACGGGSSTETAPAAGGGAATAPAAGGGQKIDSATAGELKGGVTIDGPAPKNADIKMNADPVCMKANSTPQFQETYEVGSDGKALANVFVYVKDGLGNYAYDPPTDTAQIDQHNCRYHPHALAK